MTTKHLIYTPALTLYGSDLEGAASTTTAAITEDVTYAGLYPGDTATPFIYIQAGGSPAPTTDTLIGDVRELYYGSVADGDLYHATRIHAWDWENGTVEDKVKALYTATQLMDKFCFIGSKTDADQGLEFPRVRTETDGTTHLIGGVASVPASIENAAYLIADALLSGRDPQADFESQNVKVETFGPVRTEFATDKGPQQHIANMVPSPSAWALILPFLGISTTFTMNK